jgi:hypothetical protein
MFVLSGEGGVDMVTAVKDLFKQRPLAFGKCDNGAIVELFECVKV